MKRAKMRSDILCVRCNKLLNSQKSTIKIVSIISCQQAMRAFIKSETEAKRTKKKIMGQQRRV